MKEVWKVTRGFVTQFATYNKGDMFYKEPYDGVPGTFNYFPFGGGYPLWSRNFAGIEMGMEKVFETTQPKEYFISKKYTQYEVDEMMKPLALITRKDV